MILEKKHIVFAGLGVVFMLFIVYVVYIVFLTPDDQQALPLEGKQSLSEEFPEQQNSAQKIYVDEQGKPLIGKSLQQEQEKEIHDPYYFFVFVAAQYEMTKDHLEKMNFVLAEESIEHMIYDLRRMEKVSTNTILQEQVQQMIFQVSVLKEAVLKKDVNLIKESWLRLQSIPSLQKSLREDSEN